MTEKKKVLKTKYFLRRCCFIIILLFVIWWYNNYTLKTVSTSIYSENISNPVRIAVLSDLHVHNHSISNSKIISKVDGITPDIVLVMGDMYTRRSEWNIIKVSVNLMSSLVEKGYPVYFVTGDNDTSEKYISAIQDAGVHVMNYREEFININGNNLKIMGIDNVYYSSTFDLTNEFAVDKSCYNILMAHIPNYEKFAEFGADLTVCADTHGGMVQLPFIGTMYDALTEKWFPELTSCDSVYDKGWFKYKGGAMFITSGIGDYPYPVRFCNRPEIVSIDIIPKR